MAAQILPPPLQVVGKVNGKHGFQGSVQVQYLPASNLGQIKKGNYLFVIINGKGVPFLITEISKNKDVLRIQFIDSEEKAKSLLGSEIAIAAVASPGKSAKQTNIQSINNLIGFQVWVPSENFKGEILDIVEYPQGLMMEIKPLTAIANPQKDSTEELDSSADETNNAVPKKNKTKATSKKSNSVLIPLVEEWIQGINEKEKSFELSLPEGLLQINL